MVDEKATQVRYETDEQRRAFKALAAKMGYTAQNFWQISVKMFIKTGLTVDDLATAMDNGAVEIQKLYKMIGCDNCHFVDACRVDSGVPCCDDYEEAEK